MIPKVIHYCWFGDSKQPKEVRRCIKSWKREMPEYQLRCWTDEDLSTCQVPFVQEAISKKKYAFAADYFRLYALWTEGGIYLDTDVYINKSFDKLLTSQFVGGTEAYQYNNKTLFRLEAAIICAQKRHPFVGECLRYYECHHFTNPDNTLNLKVIQEIITEIAEKKNYQRKNDLQQLDNDMMIFPTSVFCNSLIANKETQGAFVIHKNLGSWIDYSNRGLFFNLCRKYDMMDIYHIIERITKSQ